MIKFSYHISESKSSRYLKLVTKNGQTRWLCFHKLPHHTQRHFIDFVNSLDFDLLSYLLAKAGPGIPASSFLDNQTDSK